MGKTLRGAKKESYKQRKRRTDKHVATDAPLDEETLMRQLQREQKRRVRHRR